MLEKSGRRFRTRAGHAVWLLVLAACADPQPRTDAPGLRVGDVLGTVAGADTGADTAVAFARADRPRVFEFPEDHGAHPDFRSEWWYLTLVLSDAAGREFGVQFTVFRQALFPGAPADDPWRNGQSYLGHFAVTDVQTGTHREAERLARGHPALAGARGARLARTGNPTAEGTLTVLRGPLPAERLSDSVAPARTTPVCGAAQWERQSGPRDGAESGFCVWLEDWRLAGDGERWNLEASAEQFAVSLRLHTTKAVVLQGERGLSAKGPDQASYYYSVPRLQASGEVQIGSEVHAVSGVGWLDREWSTSVLGEHQVGWDWFALMLDSGEDIMAFRLRRDDGARDPYDHGVLVTASGESRSLSSGDFALEPLGYWRDERGAEWPTKWALTLGSRRWLINAPVSDQRMDTLLTYWEGLVHVLDPQGRIVGRGYMELTGYR